MDWPLTVCLGRPHEMAVHAARELPETGRRITACAVVLGYRDTVWDDTGSFRQILPEHSCPVCHDVLQASEQEQHQNDDQHDDQNGDDIHSAPPVG
jgi:hypothetical protein